jgi:hypothetical protein
MRRRLSMAYVVAIHDISEPDKFWATAGAATEFPPGVALHSTYPRDDGARAVCLWEGDSVDAIQQLVDGVLGDFSRNEFFEVNPQHAGARGLPTEATAGSIRPGA